MNKEEFIKQRCEIDKITEEEFERTYRVVECNCGKIYCKGYRCLDLDGLSKENQELKKQLEEYKKDIEDLDNQNQRAFKNMQLNQLKTCNMIKQQKEFINYLEDEIQKLKERDIYQPLQRMALVTLEHNLQKYKKIIGGRNE